MKKGIKLYSYVGESSVIDRFTYNDISRSRYSLTASHKGQEFDLSWLDKAASVYKISKNPEDYVYNKLKALTIDLPNRNMNAFPMDEVLRFDTIFGMPVYKTFEGKPIYHNHNQVLDDAKGFILHACIENIGLYNYIVLINAIDKIKAPQLAKRASDINTPTYYSMGSTAYSMLCSVCGNDGIEAQNKCTHILNNKLGSIFKGKLVYEEARMVAYEEESVVDDPADSRATRYDIDCYSK